MGPSPPFVNQGGKADAARKALIGDTVFFVVKEAVNRTGATSCFVTLGLHATWRPATVFGSDLSLGFGANDRADELFKCVSGAHLVLKVFALPGESRVAEWTAERVNYKLCLTLWDTLNTRLGPLQWDLMASDANAQSLAEGGGYITPLHTVACGGFLRD